MIGKLLKFNKLPLNIYLPLANCFFRRHSTSTRTEIVQQVGKFLSDSEQQSREKADLFIGTGQYYQHKTDDRVIVLSTDFEGDNSHPQSYCEIIDASLNASEVSSLAQEISLHPSKPLLYSGELDCVDKSPWNFGYSVHPKFSIFSKQGLVCRLSHSSKTAAFRLFTGSLFENVCLSDISYVQLSLSGEPWFERTLELKLRSGEILEVIGDYRREGSKGLAELMMSTDWMVKAAGQICLITRQQSDNCDISLRLPKELRGDFNQWVALRNSVWAVESSK